MGSGPSNARPAKVLKTGSGQPSTKQAKVPVDILGAHATDKDLVDEGLEGDIAVRVRWSMRALVQLAPHGKRVEFREAEGPGARGEEEREEDSGASGSGGARLGGPLHMTPALPTLGAEDEEEVSGVGILGVPDLGEGDDSAPVVPEGVARDGKSESAKSVWRLTDVPATEFERVTQRVGELRELEASMADYAATCKRESVALQFELLHLQTTLGETWRLQEMLVEVRREAEEALWDILAFE
ncbi:hypothetical protein C0991_004820 [Blastosporella zonata]|nr:hypothetical protein C0991_004820 [Blastosporella zonata]